MPGERPKSRTLDLASGGEIMLGILGEKSQSGKWRERVFTTIQGSVTVKERKCDRRHQGVASGEIMGESPACVCLQTGGNGT